jgi:hypothetical protein
MEPGNVVQGDTMQPSARVIRLYARVEVVLRSGVRLRVDV